MLSAILGLWLYHALCVELDTNFRRLRGVQDEPVAAQIPPDARLPLCSPNAIMFRAQLCLRVSRNEAGMGGGTPRGGTMMPPCHQGLCGWVFLSTALLLLR